MLRRFKSYRPGGKTVAFFDESDTQRRQPVPAPERAPRSKLVPILLVLLNVAVIALVIVLAWPRIEGWFGGSAGGPETVAQASLDPEMLITPTGRKLDVQEFQGFVFEVTRVAFATDPRSRTVTITVPGKPPQLGVFRVGESFGGGKLRVVDISSAGVVLECNGTQQTFLVQGATQSEIWDKPSPGTNIMPAKGTGAIPNLAPGEVRPASKPVIDKPVDTTTDQPQPADEPGDTTDEGGISSLEDLPDERYTVLERDDYDALRRELKQVFERDFVFAVALEPETRIAYGLLVKNLSQGSVFYQYGLRKGDVLMGVNGHETLKYADLAKVAEQTQTFQDEIVLSIWRNNGEILYVFSPGERR